MFFCRKNNLILFLRPLKDFNSIISIFILQCFLVMVIKIKFELFKKIIFLLLPFLFVSSIFLNACLFEDLGLPKNIESPDKADGGKEIIVETDIDEEVLFLEMKAKQNDLNPLNDINVRKAIFHAVDRERIVDELFGDYGKVLNSLFVESSPFFNPSWSEYDYDLKKAKEYLDMTSYDIDNPLYLDISTINNSNSKKIIEGIIQEDLRKIGIHVWIFNKDPKQFYQEYVRIGDYELGLWSLYNYNGTNLKNTFYSTKIPPMETEDNPECENFYWYENLEIDSLFDGLPIETGTGSVQEKDNYFQIQDILAKDAAVLPLYSRIFSIAYSDKIKHIDLEIKDNNLFFNIEEWILSNAVKFSETEENEIIVGIEGDGYNILDSFKSFFINDLMIRGLWETNKEGEYISTIVKDFIAFRDEVTGSPKPVVNITLEDNIKWENGNPLTSEDIKNTYERLIEIDSFIEFNEEYLNIDKIEIIDETRFNIVLKEYYPNWRKLFEFIIPTDQLESGKDILDYTIEDIKSLGPYKVSEFEEGNYLLLERNDFYSGKKPELDFIRFVFDKDINNLISMIKDGEIDVLSIPVDVGLMEEIESSDGLNLMVVPGHLMEHLALSFKPVE